MKINKVFYLMFLILIAISSQARAVESIGIKLIDGKVIARASIICNGKKISTNIIFQLGSAQPLTLSNSMLQAFEIKDMDQLQASKFEISFNATRCKNLSGMPGSGSWNGEIERFTADNAPALGEVPIGAMLGLSAFGDRAVVLDIGAKTINLLSPAELAIAMLPPDAKKVGTGELGVRSDVGKGVIVPMTWDEQLGSILLCKAAAGDELTTLIDTSRGSSVIDSMQVKLAKLFGDKIGSLEFGEIDLSKFSASRFQDLSNVFTSPVGAIIGTNVLRHFTVTFDKKGSRIKLVQTASPPDHKLLQAEQEFFIASHAGDADAIEEFINDNSASRLAAEASFTLVNIRMQPEVFEYAPVKRAIDLVAKHARKDRACRYLNSIVDFLGRLEDVPKKTELLTHTLTLALAAADTDLEGIAAHQVHLRIGKVALDAGDIPKARLHLLSAAFGMPKDPGVNYLLGVVYEKIALPMAAWSRYTQSVLEGTPGNPTPPAAFICLDRLTNDPEFRKDYSLTELSQILEGRLGGKELHPAERHTDTETKEKGNVKLVEFFAGTWDSNTMCGEIAFNALTEYFQGQDIVMINYGLSAMYGKTLVADPLTSPIATQRAKFYDIKKRSGATAFFDGQDKIKGQVKRPSEEAIQKVYETFRKKAVLDKSCDNNWKITGNLKRAKSVLKAKVNVAGVNGSTDLKLHLILCEKDVLSRYVNGIMLHRYVARHALSPAGGFDISKDTGRDMDVEVDAAELTKQLREAMEQAPDVQGFPPLARRPYVDSKACVLAVIIQNEKTKQVLAAKMLECDE